MPTMKFESKEAKEEFLRYFLPVAERRFVSLGLGASDTIPKNIQFPSGQWNSPCASARSGAKLVIFGESGCGKTAMLKRIAWVLCLDRFLPRGGYVPSLLNRLKSDEMQQMKDWLSGRNLQLDGQEDRNIQAERNILVLDDFDKMRGTDFEVTTFMALIQKYDVENKSILVTMNVRPDEFVARLIKNGVPEDYAEAMFSRLHQRCQFVEMEGRDFRRS